MKIQYQREMNHHYLILEVPEEAEHSYLPRMLEQNKIPGLLPVRGGRMNGELLLYYDITSRQPLCVRYEKSGMGEQEVKKLLQGLLDVMEGMEAYLLDFSCVLCAPEYVYLDEDGTPAFCCRVPKMEHEARLEGERADEPGTAGFGMEGDGEPENGMTALAEFVLRHLDHSDKQAVNLGYSFYARVRGGEEIGTEALKELLRSQAEPNGGTAKETSAAEDGNCVEETADFSFAEQEMDFWRELGVDDTETREKQGARKEKMRGKKTKEQKENRKKNVEERNARDKNTREITTGEKAIGETGAGRKRTGAKETSAVGNWRLWGIAVAALTGLYCVVLVLLHPSLSQAGGIAGLEAGGLWLGYRMVEERKRRPHRDRWVHTHSREEDDFLQALMEEVYDPATMTYGKEPPF